MSLSYLNLYAWVPEGPWWLEGGVVAVRGGGSEELLEVGKNALLGGLGCGFVSLVFMLHLVTRYRLGVAGPGKSLGGGGCCRCWVAGWTGASLGLAR